MMVVTLVPRVTLLVETNPLIRDWCGLSVAEVAIANPLQGNPVFVDVVDLIFGGSPQCVLTSAIVLVSCGFPSLRIVGRARDGRPRTGPTGKITGVVFSQFSKLEVQLLGVSVLCFPAMDIYIASELGEMLEFCFDIGFVISRIVLERFLLLASA
jgi:hypothetical protein